MEEVAFGISVRIRRPLVHKAPVCLREGNGGAVHRLALYKACHGIGCPSLYKRFSEVCRKMICFAADFFFCFAGR